MGATFRLTTRELLEPAHVERLRATHDAIADELASLTLEYATDGRLAVVRRRLLSRWIDEDVRDNERTP